MESLLVDPETLLRLFLALVLGGLVGLERQSHGRSAGLRTNILVCLGSAAVIVAFHQLYVQAESSLTAESAIRMDPARAAAGVITGVGFLGAGTILKSRTFIRGLTTAASIWVVAAIGIVTGLGEYATALLLTGLVLLTLLALHRLKVPSDRYASLRLSLEVEERPELAPLLEEEGFAVKHEGYSLRRAEGRWELRFDLRYRDPRAVPRLLGRLAGLPGLESLSWE